MQLRDYQHEAVSKIIDALFRPGSSTLGVAATGMGKTVVLSYVVDHFAQHGRVLILAHRAELIRQAVKTVERITGHRAEVEMASDRADINLYNKAQIVVASKDSLAFRMEKFNPKDFSLIVTDEAHHAVARRYRKIYDYFRDGNPDIRHFGVTATADRLDGVGMGTVYDSVAFDYGIRYGVENGWLVDVVPKRIANVNVDFTKVKARAGDFNIEDLDRELSKHKIVWGMANAIVGESGDRRCLVFCVTVRHAMMLAEIINQKKPGTAEIVSGKTPKDERVEILRKFEAGEIQYLCNVDVLTEGFDSPGVSMVAMCRMTQSRAKYVQMLGRGTRVLPGVVDGIEDRQARLAAIGGSPKADLLVLDFYSLTGKHKLVTAIDVLAGDEPDNVRAELKMMAADTEKPTRDMVDEAKERIAQREKDAKAEMAKRLANVEAKVSYSSIEGADPFDVLDVTPPQRSWLPRVNPPSDKMRKLLEKNGIDTTDMSKTEAGRLCGEIIKRFKTNKPTFKQEFYLKSNGIDTAGMTKADASMALDRLFRKERA